MMVKWFSGKNYYTISLNSEKKKKRKTKNRADFNGFYYNFMRQVLLLYLKGSRIIHDKSLQLES